MKEKKQVIAIIIGILLLAGNVVGCAVVEAQTNKKVRDLDFTVVSDERMPEELKRIVEEKKLEEFKITFEDQGSLYICVGYGEQESGGFSITVKDLYLTENAVYVDTNLLGPSVEESQRQGVSYPVIVLKMENLDKTVVFE